MSEVVEVIVNGTPETREVAYYESDLVHRSTGNIELPVPKLNPGETYYRTAEGKIVIIKGLG